MTEQAEADDGLSMMQDNMAALESGEDVPHDEEMAISSEEPTIKEEEKKTGAKHMTKEDWEAAGNDPDEYMSEGEFNRVADFKETSKLDLSRKLAKMEKLLTDNMKNQTKMIQDAETRTRETTVAELKEKQQSAIDDSDTEKALDIEREIQEVSKEPVKDDEPGELGSAQQEWFDGNSSWYTVDPSATNLMNVELNKAEREGLPVEKGLAQAQAKVKQHFPYYFEEEAKPKARPKQMSEKTRRPGKSSEVKKTFSDLPEEQRTVAKRAAKASGLSESEYMEMME